MDPYWIRPSPVGPRQVVLIGLVVVFASVGFSSSETRGQTNFEDEEAETVVLSSTKVDPVDQDARTLANSWTGVDPVAAAALENRQLPGHHLRRNRRAVTSSSRDTLESSPGGTSSSSSRCSGGCGTGTCKLQNDEFLCECPHGKEGPGCENDKRILEPAFDGESYLKYTFPEKITSFSLEMSFKFESTEDAVILGFSRQVKRKIHLIQLNIKDRVLVFHFTSKYSSSTLSSQLLEANKWMNVSLNLSTKTCSMDISGNKTTEKKRLSRGGFILSPKYISIGGYVNATDSLLKVDRGFKGCLKEVKINGIDIFQEQPQQSSNVAQCMEPQCQPNTCNERGLCSDDPAKPGGYTCNCNAGYSGHACEILEFCEVDEDCSNGGTCVSRDAKHFCICRPGFTGERCEGTRFEVSVDSNSPDRTSGTVEPRFPLSEVPRDSNSPAPGGITPSACPVGGCGTERCIVQNGEVWCECPHGKEGPSTCKNNKVITEPAFDGESYLTYTFPKELPSLSLEMSLKYENMAEAVILGTISMGHGRHSSTGLEIKDGSLVFKFNSEFSLKSDPVVRKKWVKLYIHLTQDSCVMKVDGKLYKDEQHLLNDTDVISLPGSIFIGGYVDREAWPRKVDRGFKGCMKEIKLNGQEIFREFPLESDNVAQCNEPKTSCEPNTCNGNGQCSEDPENKEGYTCNCNAGYSGRDCESRVACPAEERTLLNTTWNLNTTAKGDNVTLPCPGANNFIWRCDDDAYWDDTPDLSFCRTHERLFMPSNSTTTLLAADNLTELAEIISDGHLFPGDVLVIMIGLKELQKQNHEDTKDNTTHGQILSQRYISNLVNVTSEVLKKPQVWHLMPEEEAKVSSTELQEYVVDAALKMAESFPTNITKNYRGETVDVVIVKQPPEYYKERENRTYKHPSNDGTSILLPENFLIGGSENEGSVLVNVIFNSYSTIHCQTNTIPCNPKDENNGEKSINPQEVFKRQVNSVVIGAVIGTGGHWRSKSDEYVEVNLTHVYKGSSYKLHEDSVECAWWNTSKNDWVSDDGCKVHSHTRYYTICHCFHLTNLAVLMDIGGILEENPALNIALEWITTIGSSVSIIFLVVGFVSFLLLKLDYNKKNAEVAARKCLTRMHLCGCLLVAYVVLLSGLKATEYRILCAAIAAVLQFFYLASFTWSAIEAFNLYLAFFLVLDTKFNFISEKLYLLVGYLVPAGFVVMNLVSFQGEGFGTEKWCWLDRSSVLWSFVGCIALIMLINLVAFVAVMRKVWMDRAVMVNPRNNPKPTCRKVIGSMTIFAVLGLTWITGFLYHWKGFEFFAVIFVLLNSLQGFAIVFLEIICDERNRTALLVVLHIKAQNKRVPTNVRRAIAKSLRLSRGPVPVEEMNLSTTITTFSNSNTDA